MKLFKKYHSAKLSTGTAPFRRGLKTEVIADERVNIHKSLIEGGTDFKGNDEGNRIQHPLRCS